MSQVSVAEVTLSESPLWRRAHAISPGQQLWGVRATSQQSSQRFDGRGMVQPLGQRYARTVTWRQLLQADPSTQESMRGYMRDNHVTENDVAATAAYDVRQSDLGFLADWAYGLTRSWTIGAQLPLTYRETTIASKVELTPVLAQGRHQPSQRKTLLGLPGRDLRLRLAALADRQLRADGYDSIPSKTTEWIWGDVNLISRTQLIETYHWIWALQPNVRLPTSRNPVVTNYIQQTTDEGQLDLGMTSLLDLHLGGLIYGLRLGYVAQLPDTIRVAMPSESQPEAYAIRRDLGDYVWASLDGEIQLTRRLDLNGGHSFFKKAQDRYSSPASAGIEDAALGEGSAQELHQTWIGMQYRIGEGYERDGIESKWVLSIAYNHPWIGRNTATADQASLEMTSYF